MKLRIESVFISFVSFSFNKRHVSVPTRTSSVLSVLSVLEISKQENIINNYEQLQ